MRFEKKIYDYDWRRLTTHLIPVVLRKPRLMALASALTSAVAALHVCFLQYKKAVEIELTTTSQVCYLQRYLNDNYDYSLRRIRITDGEVFDPIDLYLELEGIDKGVPMPVEGEAEAEYAYYTEEESLESGVDFFVRIPKNIDYDLVRIKAEIDKHKLPTKRYKIAV